MSTRRGFLGTLLALAAAPTALLSLEAQPKQKTDGHVNYKTGEFDAKLIGFKMTKDFGRVVYSPYIPIYTTPGLLGGMKA